MVNAWMNTPNGFNITAFMQLGTVTDVNPWTAFTTPSTFAEVSHVLVTTIFAGCMLLGIYLAYGYMKSRDAREKTMMNKGLKLVWMVSLPMLVLTGITGTGQLLNLLVYQPLKYAAFEFNIVPGTNLPERLFGTISNGMFSGGISIPGMQSFLADFGSGVKQLPGLSQFPQSIWPPLIVHATFGIMVTGGLVLLPFYMLGPTCAVFHGCYLTLCRSFPQLWHVLFFSCLQFLHMTFAFTPIQMVKSRMKLHLPKSAQEVGQNPLLAFAID